MHIKVLPTGFTPWPYKVSKYVSGGSETVALGHMVASELAEFKDGRRSLREHSVSKVR